MYKRIMIVVDDAPINQSAVREGTALAAAHGAEAVYLGLTADYPATMADTAAFGVVAPDDFHQAAIAKTEELLSDAMAHADRAGVLARKVSTRTRVDARSVVETARRRRCDLIVVATGDQNAVMRLITGSLVPGLITSSPVPVLVCKERRAATMNVS